MTCELVIDVSFWYLQAQTWLLSHLIQSHFMNRCLSEETFSYSSVMANLIWILNEGMFSIWILYKANDIITAILTFESTLHCRMLLIPSLVGTHIK